MIERRDYALTEIEIRDVGFNKPLPRFRGQAALWNTLSQPLGVHGRSFREQIAPGAFSRAIAEKRDVPFLINHDPNLVLGRTSAGTLELRETDTGLEVQGDFPDTSYARDLVISMERGDISGMSFGFVVKKDSWEKRSGENIRTLQDLDLLDVSAVTFPAYVDTTTELEERAIATALREMREGKAISSKNRDLILAAIEALSGLVMDEPEQNSIQHHRLRLLELDN